MYLLQWGFKRAGVYDFPKTVAAVAQRFGFDGSAFAIFFDRANTSMIRNGDQAMVRIALDERHIELRDRLLNAEQKIREAVGQVQGLAGQGSQSYVAEVAALRERTKLVDRLGVDLPPEIENEYAARKRLTGQLWVLTPLTIVIAFANGALLSVLFSEMTAMEVFGFLRLSYLLGVVVIALELGIGLAIYHFRKNLLISGVLAVLVIAATLFEANAMGVFSVEFATSMRGVDISEATLGDYWMVLLAIVFTPMTSIFGYITEQSRAELDELSGRLKLRDEMRKCNAFVDGLPQVWTSIDQKARSAEAAIERLQDQLGGQGDRLAGAIDAVVDERKQLSAAILQARIEDWPNLVAGMEGDARNAAVQNILALILTLAAIAGYTVAIGFVALRATEGAWPLIAYAAIGLITSLLFAVVGALAFNRLRLTQGSDGRALPMSSQPFHKAVAAVLLVGCAIGLIWMCVVAIGLWGIIAGIFLTALGGVVAFAGFQLERAGRGLVLLCQVLAALAVALVSAILALGRYVLLWLTAITVWLAGFLVSVLALPVTMLVDLLARRRSDSAPAA